MTEKQNSFKTCTKSPQKETPSIYGKRCSFDQKTKRLPYEADMNRLKSYKSRNLLLAKSFYKYRSQQQQLASSSLGTYPTPGEVSLQYLRTIRTQCSNLWKLNNFSLYKKRCAATIKPKSLLMILPSLQFILFCVQKMILYQIVARISKRLFPAMTCALHWWGGHRNL